MFNSGYPTTNFSWNDISGASTDVLFSAPTEGLNVPFAFVMAERGVPGAISYGSAAELVPILGAATFDPTGPYFNSSTQFIGTAMAGQGVEVMRLVDPDAKTATLGLFCSVTYKNVVQYQKNVDGERLVNDDGDFLPRLAADGTTPITEPGVVIKWSVRELSSSELFDVLAIKTVVVGGVTTVTYPVFGIKLRSPGKYGNRQGFSFFSSPTKGVTAAQALKTVLYRFVPIELASAVSTTGKPIADAFGAQFNDVTFKDQAVYGPTNTNYSINYALNNAYVVATTGREVLPYEVHTYGANIGKIGQEALSLSPELGAIDPYQIDLMAGTNLEGDYYDHIEIHADSASVVNSVVTNYAKGGTDGDTSWAKFETLVQEWLEGSDHGEFTNLQQHPMTHFSDPGFSLPVKNLLFNMLDLRDNFKIDISTQDVSRAPNTKAEDISVGQALLFRAQMHPESVINGVGCCRVGIYAHAAQLVTGSGYEKLVPFNFNRLIQRRDLDGGLYIKGSAGGLPNSAVTRFKKPNWVADDENAQALSWANCINTVRHATRTQIFYPSLRTVYPNDTSLLSDDEISDRIIYMFKICREVWAIYAGVRQPPKSLYSRIESDINTRCAAAFSGDSINVNATVGQTARDANLGSQVTVNIAITGNSPLRTMNFDVTVGRADA